MSTKIEVNHLYKIFGKKPKSVLNDIKNGATKEEILKKSNHAVGVNDVSFRVEEGELFVVMGLSGSGKSTLIRCLNRLHDPTAGDILVDGENVSEFNKQKLREFRQRKIGMVFQHFGLLSHRTVLENVEYGLEVRNVSKEERREAAEKALESVGLTGWEDRYPGELSGGMQQRVGLARALANDPDILLMDEPFSALDPLIRRDMQLELLELQERLKKTIVFITHDINEAFKIGDRVAVMKDGGVEQIDDPENILANPASEYIREFISDIDRSKVLQADQVMKKPNALVSLKDGIKVAIKEMEMNDLSSVFVVDRQRHLQGIVTIEDAVEGIKQEKTLDEIVNKDISTAKKEDYVNDIIPKVLESKFPVAVIDDKGRLEGIILRIHVLTSLVAEDVEVEYA